MLLLLPQAAATAAGASPAADPSGTGPPPAAVIAPPAAPTTREPGTEVIEVVLPDAADAASPVPDDVARQVAAAGGEVVGAATGSVLLVEIPTDAAAGLEIDGAQVREPVGMSVPLHTSAAAPAFGGIAGESAAAIGAPAWHEAGFDGTGVRIGVIDFFSTASFWNSVEMGPKPTAANGRAMCRFRGTDCIAGFDDTVLPGDGRQHGPAVVEVIRDVAPNADIFIASAETYSDYIEVIDWFAANGVTILSRSLGSFLDGPGDGTGPMAEIADHAVAQGMVWVNAAGNEGDGGYWRGPAVTVNGNPVSAPGQTIAFAAGGSADWMPLQGCTTATLRWNEGWDDPAGAHTRYDLEVYQVDVVTGAAVMRSRAERVAEPLRQLAPTCPQQVPGGNAQRLFLQVVYRGGGGTPGNDVLEIQDYRVGLGIHQAAYSAALPAADSKNPSVLAVGAIDPPAGTQIAAYSSQGPTNDGRIKPDVVAPAGVTNSVYGTFSGTSASTPAAAGTAALLLQAGLAAPGPTLAALLRTAVLPIGAPTPNNTYGTGVLRLPPAPAASGAEPPTAYHALGEPVRIVDTRPASPVGPPALTGLRAPATVLDIPVEALLGRTTGAIAAVALNLTVVDAVEPGWVQVVPKQRAGLGAYSNLNIDAAGQTRSNIVQVPVGVDGSISVYLGSGGDALVDVLGTYEYDGTAVDAGRFEAMDPVRVLDTRGGAVGATGSGPDGALRRGEAVCLDTVAAGISGDGVSAVVLNVTATEVTDVGYVQALPTGGAVGSTSTLNLVPGATVANTTIVPLGGACGASGRSASVVFDAGNDAATAHLVVDVTGYISGTGAPPGSTGLFVPLTPGRVLDSRPEVLATGAVRTVQVAGADGPGPAVPADASGVAANLTATSTTGWGYLSAWPAGGALPATSSLNWSGPGATVANGAIVKLSTAGALDLRSVTPGQVASAAHLLDIFGYYL